MLPPRCAPHTPHLHPVHIIPCGGAHQAAAVVEVDAKVKQGAAAALAIHQEVGLQEERGFCWGS